MSFYLVCGQGASTDPRPVGEHLPTLRPRRYPSDTDDDEWALIAPYAPVGGTTDRGGRPPEYPRRDIVDAIRYVDRTSCQWRALPADFPPWITVYHYFRAWNRDGTLTRMHDGLRGQVRQALGRHPDPTAAAADSQAARAAEAVARTSRGYDAVFATSRFAGLDPWTVPQGCGQRLCVSVGLANSDPRFPNGSTGRLKVFHRPHGVGS